MYQKLAWRNNIGRHARNTWCLDVSAGWGRVGIRAADSGVSACYTCHCPALRNTYCHLRVSGGSANCSFNQQLTTRPACSIRYIHSVRRACELPKHLSQTADRSLRGMAIAPWLRSMCSYYSYFGNHQTIIKKKIFFSHLFHCHYQQNYIHNTMLFSFFINLKKKYFTNSPVAIFWSKSASRLAPLGHLIKK